MKMTTFKGYKVVLPASKTFFKPKVNISSNEYKKLIREYLTKK